MLMKNKKTQIKAIKLFLALLCSITFANANFGINNSNYQQKETVLTSITGGSVNIEVGGNTNLKGSLIAAGYFDENNNFIDNSKLSLTTDTLTYSSLSDTMFSNSHSFGGGTNIGFSETYTEDANGNKNTNTNSKVNSSSLNFGTNIGYSSSKVLATIGQGSIIVKDKDNSDDINSLNKDANSQINKLYEGSVGTSVEASIDHRLLSEEGRKDIAGDFFVTGNLASSILDAITKGSQSMGDVGRNYKILEAVQNIVAANPKLFEEYNNPEISIERKNEIDAQITNMILTEAGYQPVTVLGMNNDIKDKNGKSVQGYYDPDSNTIFLNNGQVITADQSVYTLGHEAAGHAVEHQDNKNFATEKLSEENADIMAGYVTRATNFALWQNGQGQLGTNGYTNINDITQTISNNNLLFAGMDKSNGQSLAPAIGIALGVLSFSEYANAPGPEDETYSGPTGLVVLSPLTRFFGTKGGTTKELSPQEIKSIRSYEKLIEEHEKKDN
jgi:hypothetical protein